MGVALFQMPNQVVNLVRKASSPDKNWFLFGIKDG